MASSSSHVLQQTTALLIIICMFSAATVTTARHYVVGDATGWTAGISYIAWASGKKFFVGDTLQFNYDTSVHDVLRVSQSSYDQCSNESPMATRTTGKDVITLKKPGTSFFICGISDHCSGYNQKLKVRVYARP